MNKLKVINEVRYNKEDIQKIVNYLKVLNNNEKRSVPEDNFIIFSKN